MPRIVLVMFRLAGCLSLGETANDPQADVVRLLTRIARIVSDGRAVKGSRSPRAAAHHRIARFARAFIDPPVLAPFPDIAQHIVQTPGIGRQLANGLPSAAGRLALGVRRVSMVEQGKFLLPIVFVTKVPRRGGPSSSRPFPLGLGR